MKIFHMTLAAALVLTLAACTTMGIGVGSTPTGDLRAVISWKSMSDRDGVMTAMLSNGETYSGMYFQITSETRLDTLDPLWVGWARPWSDWAYLGPEPITGFVTHYSGRVVANLGKSQWDAHALRIQAQPPRLGDGGWRRRHMSVAERANDRRDLSAATLKRRRLDGLERRGETRAFPRLPRAGCEPGTPRLKGASCLDAS